MGGGAQPQPLALTGVDVGVTHALTGEEVVTCCLLRLRGWREGRQETVLVAVDPDSLDTFLSAVVGGARRRFPDAAHGPY